MPYHPLDLPPGTPPNAEHIVRTRIDPLLRQVHAMLLLPVEDAPGLDIVCKQSVALVLLGVVSGVSEKLYKPPKGMGTGERFKRVLTNYYPWRGEPKTAGTTCGKEAAETIYKTFRNPLAHTLGISDYPAKFFRGAATDVKLEKFEKSKTRPRGWNKPTLKKGHGRTTLNIKIFYWGVRRLIWKLLSAQATATADE